MCTDLEPLPQHSTTRCVHQTYQYNHWLQRNRWPHCHLHGCCFGCSNADCVWIKYADCDKVTTPLHPFWSLCFLYMLTLCSAASQLLLSTAVQTLLPKSGSSPHPHYHVTKHILIAMSDAAVRPDPNLQPSPLSQSGQLALRQTHPAAVSGQGASGRIAHKPWKCLTELNYLGQIASNQPHDDCEQDDSSTYLKSLHTKLWLLIMLTSAKGGIL